VPLKWDPVSRTFVEEAYPAGMVDPNAPADIAPMNDQMAFGESGASPAPPVAPAAPMPQFLFPPKPESETTTSHVIQSQASRDASQAKDLAHAGELSALNAQGVIDIATANAEKNSAAEKAALMEQQAGAMEIIKADRERQRVAHMEERKNLISQEIEDKKKAGAAEADYWKDNEGKEIFAALLMGVGQAVQTFMGGSGPSPAERIIDKAIQRHRNKLVGKWEASEQARKLKDSDIFQWQQERDRVESEADRQSQVELGLVDARLNAATKAQAPERAAAVTEAKQAALQKAFAEDELAEAQRYERKSSTTTRKGGELEAAKPPPLAAPADVEKLSELSESAQLKSKLADLIAENPEEWEAVKLAHDTQKSEDAANFSIPGTNFALGPGRVSQIIGNMFDKPGNNVGLDVGDKLGEGRPRAEMWRLINKVMADQAKDQGGNPNKLKLEMAQEQLGLGERTAPEMIMELERQIAEDTKKREAIERVRRTK
jgi:hypothetical protein